MIPARQLPIGSFRREAEEALACLVVDADEMVATATTLYIASWLDWPAWLRDGTSLHGSGPLPSSIAVRDDLIIVANILDHVGPARILEWAATDAVQLIGPVGSTAVSNAADLRQALSALARMINVNGHYVRALVEQDRDLISFLFIPRIPPCRLANFVTLMGCIVLKRLIRPFAPDESSIEISSTYSSMSEVGRLDEYLGCRMLVGSESCKISMPAQWASRPNILADEMLWTVTQAQIANIETAKASSKPLQLIRQTINDMMTSQNGAPRLKRVAEKIGVSSRTLSRMLESRGTSFHAVLAEQRKLRATVLMLDEALSLAQIAHELGFPDQSSFGRSFRQWFGTSPGRYRRVCAKGPVCALSECGTLVFRRANADGMRKCRDSTPGKEQRLAV